MRGWVERLLGLCEGRGLVRKDWGWNGGWAFSGNFAGWRFGLWLGSCCCGEVLLEQYRIAYTT